MHFQVEKHHHLSSLSLIAAEIKGGEERTPSALPASLALPRATGLAHDESPRFLLLSHEKPPGGWGHREVGGSPEEQLVSNSTPTGCPPSLQFQGTEMSGRWQARKIENIICGRVLMYVL